jgi:hypothetical protein
VGDGLLHSLFVRCCYAATPVPLGYYSVFSMVWRLLPKALAAIAQTKRTNGRHNARDLSLGPIAGV